MEIAALVSGGVDSSVVVHQLKEAGYDPTIFYIRIGMEDKDGYIDCPAEEDIDWACIPAGDPEWLYAMNRHTQLCEPGQSLAAHRPGGICPEVCPSGPGLDQAGAPDRGLRPEYLAQSGSGPAL